MESCIRWESHAMHWKPRCSGDLVEHKDHCSPALVRSIARKLHSLLPICPLVYPFLPSYCLHLLASACQAAMLGQQQRRSSSLGYGYRNWKSTRQLMDKYRHIIIIVISYAGYMTILNASNEPCLDCGGKDFLYMFATMALIISFFLPHMWFSKLSAFKHTLRDTHVSNSKEIILTHFLLQCLRWGFPLWGWPSRLVNGPRCSK